jgi:hypothetical protein
MSLELSGATPGSGTLRLWCRGCIRPCQGLGEISIISSRSYDTCKLGCNSTTEKKFNISIGVQQLSKERILQEIAKCSVLCSNCHRKLHWDEKYNNMAHLADSSADSSKVGCGLGSTPP